MTQTDCPTTTIVWGMFSTAALCTLADITYRQADYWCRNRVLEPASAGGAEPGSGYGRRFTTDEAFVARAIGDLAKLGMLMPIARTVARQLRTSDTRDGLVFVDDAGNLTRALTGGSCYVLDLDHIADGLTATTRT